MQHQPLMASLAPLISPWYIFAGWLRTLAKFDRGPRNAFFCAKEIAACHLLFSDSMVFCAHAARSIIMVLGASDTEQMSRAAADKKHAANTQTR